MVVTHVHGDLPALELYWEGRPNAVNSTYWSKCIDTATDELDLAKVVANRQQFEADREWFKAELLDAIRSWEEVTEAALAI